MGKGGGAAVHMSVVLYNVITFSVRFLFDF